MTPDALVRTVEEFLSQAHDAVVLEDGAVAFDLAQAKYSISGERNKCLLHLWSAERNVVRRVVDLELRTKCCDLRSSAWGNLTLRNSKSAASVIAVRRPRNGQHGSHIKGSCNAY